MENLFISLNKLEKILHSLNGEIVDLSEIFQRHLLSFYKPSMSSTIDETMIAFSGKSSIKVFIQGKPHPNGFKFYSFVDASGILCRFFLHTKTKLTLLQIFERLLDTFPNHSLKIYADQYFGSYDTAQYLQSRGFKFLMAMSSIRPKKFWKAMTEIALKNGLAEKSFLDLKGIRAISIKHGSKVFHYLLNHVDLNTDSFINQYNFHQQYSQFIIKDYNENMGRVDHFNQAYDQHLPNIRQKNKDVGLRRTLLRFAVVNAYHLYELYHNKKITQQSFLEELIYQLLGFSKQGWKQYQKHLFISSKKVKRCTECMKKRKYSNCTHYCSYCERYLCKKCYLKIHIK